MKIKTIIPRLFSFESIVQQHHIVSYEVLPFFYNIQCNISYDTYAYEHIFNFITTLHYADKHFTDN